MHNIFVNFFFPQKNMLQNLYNTHKCFNPLQYAPNNIHFITIECTRISHILTLDYTSSLEIV